ncbi:hypothetical protein ABZY68_25505 [Streptomyces sp. NPDC006482]
MAKAKVTTVQEIKPAVRKPAAADVAKVQARVAALVGGGELSAAPVSYHH